MLFADKRALETNLKVSLLQIREKELNFYTQNCLAVGTQAALLAGFAYAGLTQVAVPKEKHYLVKLLYLLFTAMAMGCELIAVLNTTLLSMLGPGLALRGPDGSMHKAVDGMMAEYRKAFFTFGLGLIAFHLSALMFGWLLFGPGTPGPDTHPGCARSDWPTHRGTWPPTHARCAVVATSISVCIVLALRVLWRYVVRIFQKFQLPKDMVISGRFSPETELRDSAHAQDADAGEQHVLGRCARRACTTSSPTAPFTSSTGPPPLRTASSHGSSRMAPPPPPDRTPCTATTDRRCSQRRQHRPRAQAGQGRLPPLVPAGTARARAGSGADQMSI